VRIAHLLATKPHYKHQEMGINSPCTTSSQLKASNLSAHFKRCGLQQPHQPNPGQNQDQIARVLATKPHHKHQEMGINSPWLLISNYAAFSKLISPIRDKPILFLGYFWTNVTYFKNFIRGIREAKMNSQLGAFYLSMK